MMKQKLILINFTVFLKINMKNTNLYKLFAKIMV